MSTSESRPPRALIKVKGSPTIGMGHVMRSVELVAALEDAGIQVAGFVCNDDAPSRAIVAARGHRIWSETLDFPRAVIEAQADILLLDHPGPLHPLCLEARAISPDLVVPALDCFEMEAADFDLIINLINHHPTLKVPLSPQVDYHEGPEFAIIRREFMARREVPRRPPGTTQKVLVTFGGSDMHYHSAPVIEALADFVSAGMQMTVVVGPNFPHRAEVLRVAAATGAVALENVSDMAVLMLDADLSISGGGTTMLELAALGTPALIIPQNEPETGFSASIAARAAVRTLPTDFDPQVLRREVRQLLDDPAARARLSVAAQETVDGRGQARIASLILQALARRRASHA